jgi:hypothetical protein
VTNSNEGHLFDHLAPTTEFKDFSNERVKEHAPFFIFGIWLIEKMLRKKPAARTEAEE